MTVRDGFQHEEKFVSTEAKKFYLEELIFAGCRNIEVTNLGNPNAMPQFRDAEELLAHLKGDRFKKKCEKKGINPDDVCPIKGTGEYYYDDPRFVGFVCLEDTLVQVDEMGIEHGWDVDRVLWLGKRLEKTFGKRLRSEAAINGRTLKQGHMQFARPGLKELKKKMGEAPDQLLPAGW